jgi:hypothetical protein
LLLASIVLRHVQALRAELADMKAERQAHELAIVRAQKEEQQRRIDAFTRNRAAKLLQGHWRTYITTKKKGGKASKGKGKGKGKK